MKPHYRRADFSLLSVECCALILLAEGALCLWGGTSRCLLKINCASFALAALCLDLSRGHRAVHRACILEFSGHVRQHEGNILLSFDG